MRGAVISSVYGALTLILTSATVVAQQYVISTVAGGVPPQTPVAANSASIGSPQGVVSDAAGNVYFTSIDCVFKIDRNGILTRVSGNGRGGYSGDNGPALSAQFNFSANFTGSRLFGGYQAGIAIDGAGNIIVADTNNGRVRKISSNGLITTVAGGGSDVNDGVAATNAKLLPYGIALDGIGNLYISEFHLNRVRKVSSAGIVTTVAGTGKPGFSGDGGQATGADLNLPVGVTVDSVGNLFIADRQNFRIRKVTPTGTITTVAGNGSQGYSGDGGPAIGAQLQFPVAVAVDADGNLYIADGRMIRQVSTTGVITTVAGTGTFGSANIGDGGPAKNAQLSPTAIALDSSGNIYVAEDNTHHRIRKIGTTGIINTIAGNGLFSFSGDGGQRCLPS